jgi:hypothetical protein
MRVSIHTLNAGEDFLYKIINNNKYKNDRHMHESICPVASYIITVHVKYCFDYLLKYLTLIFNFAGY